MRRPEESYWWFRLLAVPGIGPVRYRSLLARFGHPQRIFEATVDDLCQVPGIDQRTARSVLSESREDWIEKQIEAMQRFGALLLTIDQPDYPALLSKIDDAPPLLFIKGVLNFNSRPAVAVVGSRMATQYGKAAAEHLGRELVRAGFLVASGIPRPTGGRSRRQGPRWRFWAAEWMWSIRRRTANCATRSSPRERSSPNTLWARGRWPDISPNATG